jgi:hypothetical protein
MLSVIDGRLRQTGEADERILSPNRHRLRRQAPHKVQ